MEHHKSFEESEEKPVPPAYLGPAARGNFLEVLNMSLSTFENSYLNRNLDRTGQQSIVITPGELEQSIILLFSNKIFEPLPKWQFVVNVILDVQASACSTWTAS